MAEGNGMLPPWVPRRILEAVVIAGGTTAGTSGYAEWRVRALEADLAAHVAERKAAVASIVATQKELGAALVELRIDGTRWEILAERIATVADRVEQLERQERRSSWRRESAPP